MTDQPFTTQDCPDDAPDGTCWYCGAEKHQPHTLSCATRFNLDAPQGVQVTNCPCDVNHFMTSETWRVYQEVTGGQTHIKVQAAESGLAWSIPRIYIAMHGLSEIELPLLAEHYGWEQVEGV